MLTRNVFCSLYRPFELVDNSEEMRRAREMQQIRGEQLSFQMQLYQQQALAERNNSEDYRDMIQQKAALEGRKLYNRLASEPKLPQKKYHKYHCYNADPNVQFRLQDSLPHAKQSQKLLAEQAMRNLDICKGKQQQRTSKQAPYVARSQLSEEERRRMERERYSLGDQLYAQSLEYRQAYPQKVFCSCERHDAVPLLGSHATSGARGARRQLSHRDEVERINQIAEEMEAARQQRLVDEALELLAAGK